MAQVLRLSDYKVLEYFVNHIDLEIDLCNKPFRCTASLTISPNPDSIAHSSILHLDGVNIVLESILLDGTPLLPDEYEITGSSLIIKNIPQNKTFTLQTTTCLGNNSDLFGLYETEGTILVKAETEGLRRVFFCHDRPDNLATYKTTIIANKEKYPTLLSNGILLESAELPNGVHSVTWLDKTPKPSYLFALVAGKLRVSRTYFKTKSGRELLIEFYVPLSAIEKCTFAQEVLKRAMRWDEEVFHLECHLSHYMVAGVDKYASGASEPTGLNLFNTTNLYATPESRTDEDIMTVLEVVAHEFYHYWTGNRVTIRDWFHLPLKEGLTTFRAAMLREDLFGTDLIRIFDGKNLDERAPMQTAYTEVRSLYTAAAYEKSAHIFRMMMLSLGKNIFYKAMTEFLQKNDGTAVTLEQLLNALSDSSKVDMRPFLGWFTEPGIPAVQVTDQHDPKTQRYQLIFNTSAGKSRPIPVVSGLLDSTGKEILSDSLLMLDQPEMVFTFEHIPQKPVPSLLRSFSAPVRLTYAYSKSQLLILIRHDTNAYVRCEAANQLIVDLIDGYCTDTRMIFPNGFFETYRAVLNDPSLTPWMLAELIMLPTEEWIVTQAPKPDFEKIAQGRRKIQRRIAQKLSEKLRQIIDNVAVKTNFSSPKESLFDIEAAGRRRLKAVCYSYLLQTDAASTEKELIDQFNGSLGKNMSETVSALTLLAEINSPCLSEILDSYYQYWKNDPDAMNYWFIIQAGMHSTSVIAKVKELVQHPAFDVTNPNKIRALLGTFIKNPYGFHALSGEGYQLIVDTILTLEKTNPTLASILTEKFNGRDNYDETRQNMMATCLQYLNTHAISEEVKNKALEIARSSRTGP